MGVCNFEREYNGAYTQDTFDWEMLNSSVHAAEHVLDFFNNEKCDCFSEHTCDMCIGKAQMEMVLTLLEKVRKNE